jgi:hypothetical protein
MMFLSTRISPTMRKTNAVTKRTRAFMTPAAICTIISQVSKIDQSSGDLT